MAAFDEYIGILSKYNIQGDFANILAELLAYYSENYLANVAGSYYNSSTLKAVNEDSLMQLALDHGVNIFRGRNPIVRVNVILDPNAPVDYLYFQPLQEIFSYGYIVFLFWW